MSEPETTTEGTTASPTTDEEYNVTERVQVRDECIAANDETIQRIAEKYNVAVDRQSQQSLELEFMRDYIFPPSTPLRLEYDIQWEVFFRDRLQKIEAKLSQQKFAGKLQIPRQPGLIKP